MELKKTEFEIKGLLESFVDVYIIDNGENVVDMRQLHKVLKIKTRFATWVQRHIEELSFEEGEEFFSKMGKTSPLGGRPSKEYYFKLDVAKEIAMIENRTYRKYFIELEKAVLRHLGKKTRRTFTDAVQEHWKPKMPHEYGRYTDYLINIPIFGEGAKSLKAKRNVKKYGSLRDTFTEKELKKVEKLEGEIVTLIDYGFDYQTVKEKVIFKMNVD